jgi:hypothetical protein
MTPQPPELAYLIIAHHQPAHLGRMIRVMQHPGAAFFVHVDARAPLAAFTAAIPRDADVTFVAPRLAVDWGRVSLVKALLTTLRAAVATGRPFRYFMSLSGVDYPIKPAPYVQAALGGGRKEFIRVDRRLEFGPTTPFQHLARLTDGRFYGDLVPYQGSMHWALSAACIRLVLDFIDANPGYMDLMPLVACPEEILFHSVIKQSAFEPAIAQDYSTRTAPEHLLHGVHFIDWQGLRPRAMRLNLDMRDLNDLMASPALFARKFDEKESRDLLGTLDQAVHGAHW